MTTQFTDNLDGTVTDNLTGLIWLKNANCFGLKGWAVALDSCISLTDEGCGLVDGSFAGDWRLPNIKELLTLIDYNHDEPALPSGHPFINVQSYGYWSSTTSASHTSFAWYVSFYNGGVGYDDKSGDGYVWCVRGTKNVKKTNH